MRYESPGSRAIRRQFAEIDSTGRRIRRLARTLAEGSKGRSTRRRRKSQKRDFNLFSVVILVGALLLIVEVLSRPGFLGALFLAACLLIGARFWYRSYQKHKRVNQVLATEFAQIDNMLGHEFERYIGELMRIRGYTATVTRGSGDNGVDVIASKEGTRWAIQCKRQISNVSRDAVSDAVAATNSTMFDCNKAMVVTNYYFSKAEVAPENRTGR